jgi:hypothetical protein
MFLFNANARLSILRMKDVSAFVIKGNVRAFVMEEGMGDAPVFVIKGGTPLATYVFFSFIIGDTH